MEELAMLKIDVYEEKETNMKYPARVYRLTVKFSKLARERLMSFFIYGLLISLMFLMGQKIPGLYLMALAFFEGVILFALLLVVMNLFLDGDCVDYKAVNSYCRNSLIFAYVLESITEFSFLNYGLIAFYLIVWVSVVFCSFLWFDNNLSHKEKAGG